MLQVKKIALAVATIFLSTHASALIYLGIGMYQTTPTDGIMEDLPEKERGYSISVGLDLPLIPTLEAGYVRHGKYHTYNWTIPRVQPIHSSYIAWRPSINLGPVLIYGKAGIHTWVFKEWENQNGISGMYGYGVEFEFSPFMSLGLNYTHYMAHGNMDVGGGDYVDLFKGIENMGASLVLHF